MKNNDNNNNKKQSKSERKLTTLGTESRAILELAVEGEHESSGDGKSKDNRPGGGGHSSDALCKALSLEIWWSVWHSCLKFI